MFLGCFLDVSWMFLGCFFGFSLAFIFFFLGRIDSRTFLEISFRYIFHYPKCRYQGKIENGFSVAVFFQCPSR